MRRTSPWLALSQQLWSDKSSIILLLWTYRIQLNILDFYYFVKHRGIGMIHSWMDCHYREISSPSVGWGCFFVRCMTWNISLGLSKDMSIHSCAVCVPPSRSLPLYAMINEHNHTASTITAPNLGHYLLLLFLLPSYLPLPLITHSLPQHYFTRSK